MMENLEARPGQSLISHLKGVAKRARQFASAFGCEEWGELAGLWHDLGKCQDAFQRKLRGSKESVDHARVGAAYAVRGKNESGISLAFVVAGHHAGLANLASTDGASRIPLRERVVMNLDEVPLDRVAGLGILERAVPQIPEWLRMSVAGRVERDRARRRLELWIRFLFSCLVDADHLDSEAAEAPEKAGMRGFGKPIPELRELLARELERLKLSLPEDLARSAINQARAEVLDACRIAADWQPGFFSLTAPTGAGKTLSSMAFALNHAVRYGKRRVIVVLPYTSIIEQNAEVYRKVFGADSVIEHHSNLEPEEERERLGEEWTPRHRAACENWDGPLVVTTTVQFFETLFTDRPTRSKKLHRVAQSVVILDEVQSLPPEFLPTILEGLTDLVECYGSSVVLSTATPPALRARPDWTKGLAGVREILPDPVSLSQRLRRVRYQWPKDRDVVSWAEFAGRVAEHRQALVVVHKREDARTLAGEIERLRNGERIFHLSALMCAAHRAKAIGEMRQVLASGEDCICVSTQLIEAGVDIDFPVLYRALGGLDSIVQAAGRCNREGRLREGEVHVFRAPSDPPPGTPRKGLEVMEGLLVAKGDALVADDPMVCEEYFRRFYQVALTDARNIQRERTALNFETVGSLFQLIEDGFTKAILVPWGRGNDLITKLREGFVNRDVFRSLQPYTVRVYPQQLLKLAEAGGVEEPRVGIGLYALCTTHKQLYSEAYGLSLKGSLASDPASLIVS